MLLTVAILTVAVKPVKLGRDESALDARRRADYDYPFASDALKASIRKGAKL